MSDNILEPLVDSILDSGKLLFRYISKAAGGNRHDFSDLFKKLEFKNKSDEYPKLIDYKKEEYFETYLFRVPVGLSLESFEDKKEKIAFFIGANEKDLRIERKGYDIVVKVLVKRPNAEYDPETMKRKDFKIPLGYSLDSNKLIYYDLLSPSDTHCYIAGSSGGGKSIMLRVILSHLINSKNKRDIELSIINTKRVDLKYFEHVKHTVSYMTGSEGVESFLEKEVLEMESRYKLIDKKDCDDIAEFRERCYKIPYRLIVVEEISSYKGNKEYQRNIELLASQGRGAGMILMLVTQLPSHEIMPSTIKCNINTTIGLRTKTQITSDIIATNGNLHDLKGNGHAKLFNTKNEGTEFQGLYISKDMMKDIINNNLKQNKRAAVAGTTTTQGVNKNFG